MERGGYGVPVTPKGVHRVKHGAEYDDADDYADGQTEVVKILDVATEVGDTLAQIHIRSKQIGRTNTQ
jgi:hypothetical protein